MKYLQQLLSFLSLASGVISGVVLPADAPEGLMIWTAADGFANYTLLDSSSLNFTLSDNNNNNNIINTTPTKNRIEPRYVPLPVSKMGCALNLLEDFDLAVVVEKLKQYCEALVAHKEMMHSRSVTTYHRGVSVRTYLTYFACFQFSNYPRRQGGEASLPL